MMASSTDPDASQTLQLLHVMCAKEYKQLVGNMPRLVQKFKDMFAQLSTIEAAAQQRPNDLRFMRAFDRTVDALTATTRLLRKLNLLVERTVQTELGEADDGDDGAVNRRLAVAVKPPSRPDEAAIVTTTTTTVDGVVFVGCDADQLPTSSASDELEPDDGPIYLGDKYPIGRTFAAAVSHISFDAADDDDDDGTAIAYVVDTDTDAATRSAMCLQPADCASPLYDPRASSDPVFGVLLDGAVLRARLHDDDTVGDDVTSPGARGGRPDAVVVDLLDTGERVRIVLGETPIYDLQPQHCTVPAQAIRCRVRRRTDDEPPNADAGDLRAFLLSLLYDPVTVVRVPGAQREMTVIVRRSVQSAPRRQPPFASTNPFVQLLDEQSSSSSSAAIDGNRSPQLSPPAPPVPPREPAYATITASQRAALFDTDGGGLSAAEAVVSSSTSTSNALVAVTGYAPHDDERLCRHFDARTGACFKGAACRREHVATLRDGWTRDQRPVFGKGRMAQPWPAIGARVTAVVPTHIEHVDRFWAQLDGVHDPAVQTLAELTRRMNGDGPQAVGRQRPMPTVPGEQELVVARYRDGLWHRARVLQVLNARDAAPAAAARFEALEACVRVFYVDYGNCALVQMDELREWSERWDWVPFQAYECALADVEVRGAHGRKALDVQEVHELRELMLHKRLPATVVDNTTNVLVVRLLDEQQQFVLADRVCQMGLAQPRPTGKQPLLKRFPV